MEPILDPPLPQLHLRRERLLAAMPADGSQHLEHLLRDVDRALAAVEDGSWGRCSVCHDPVEEDRLVADPMVSVCLTCLSPEESRALARQVSASLRSLTRSSRLNPGTIVSSSASGMPRSSMSTAKK